MTRPMRKLAAAVALTAATATAMAMATAATAGATTVRKAVTTEVTTAAFPAGLLPLAASWTTPQRGIVLGYPSRTTGAKPYLLETGNGGKTWKSLPAPPVKYPADNDQPDAVWSGRVLVVTNGTNVEVTTSNGKHWAPEKLAGLSGSFFVDRMVIVANRVLALVTTSHGAALYSGPASSGRLRAVPGLSVSGPEGYGDLSTAGGALQVDLGDSYTVEKYWHSRNGTGFTRAALPCPIADQAFLGGVRAGKAVALCANGPSSVGPGQTQVQLRIADRLGGSFKNAGAAVVMSNVQDFAAASASAMTVATESGLEVTADAGKRWLPKRTQANGAFWTDLTFPRATTGFAVCATVSNALKEVATVYRTANGGSSWSAVPVK